MAGKRLTDAERLERIKTGLHCSDEEAREILEYDKKVDKDKTEQLEYDLDEGKRKVAAKYTRTGTRQTTKNYNFTPRARKSNATKAGIISDLMEFLSTGSQFTIENLEAVNPERLISFKIGDHNFTLTLTQNRK